MDEAQITGSTFDGQGAVLWAGHTMELLLQEHRAEKGKACLGLKQSGNSTSREQDKKHTAFELQTLI